jgi:hypothetical protein
VLTADSMSQFLKKSERDSEIRLNLRKEEKGLVRVLWADSSPSPPNSFLSVGVSLVSKGPLFLKQWAREPELRPICLFLPLLGFELRVLNLLGRCSTAWAAPPAQPFLFPLAPVTPTFLWLLQARKAAVFWTWPLKADVPEAWSPVWGYWEVVDL